MTSLRPTATQAKADPVALWIGDSYTAGRGATDKLHGEACLTSAALSLQCDLDAEGGTGYIANGQVNSPTFEPLQTRLAADCSRYPNPYAVVVDAGRNDRSALVSVLESAATRYLRNLRVLWPKARLVLIVPYFMNTVREFSPLASLYKTLAPSLHAQVIDPVHEGWISPSLTGTLTIADGVHPNPAGHIYLARHLAADMRPLATHWASR